MPGWSHSEDTRLKEIVAEYGAAKWNSNIAPRLGNGRTGKQCRERWHNQLDPTIRKDPWSAEEDRFILESVSTLGPSWTKIVKLLPPGRTDNAVKNHYNSTLAKGSPNSHKRARADASELAQQVQEAHQV